MIGNTVARSPATFATISASSGTLAAIMGPGAFDRADARDAEAIHADPATPSAMRIPVRREYLAQRVEDDGTGLDDMGAPFGIDG
ncbi:MAG: hypothetical protein ACTHQE_06795 [Thermomicrobiales bacterium]